MCSRARHCCGKRDKLGIELTPKRSKAVKNFYWGDRIEGAPVVDSVGELTELGRSATTKRADVPWGVKGAGETPPLLVTLCADSLRRSSVTYVRQKVVG